MKKYPLSTAAERAFGIIFSVLMIALLGLLLYAIRNNVAVFILMTVFVISVVIVLVLYIMNVSKAVIVYDQANGVLNVHGFRLRTIDLKDVAGLQTITVKSGHVEGRSLAFTDAEGNVVAIVPTYFTSKRGVLAEPMAKAMAADLGIGFQANVPAWEYDEEARKAHEIEVAKQEKEEARQRRAAKAALRVAKAKVRNEMKDATKKRDS